MTEKILLKINWDDIHRHFPKAVRSGIISNTCKAHVIIPTTHNYAILSEFKTCVDEWHLADMQIITNKFGFLTFELAWDNNYHIEIDV